MLTDFIWLVYKYVIVSANKAPKNIVVVCKSHYIDILIKELGIDNSLGNRTYTPTTLTKEEILDNHRSVLCSFGISTKDEELDLPSLYWIPKLHKCPFNQGYIAGSAKCSTKPLSKLLTCILSAVKTGLQSYCDTSYSRGGVNQMWILKNSKDLLEYWYHQHARVLVDMFFNRQSAYLWVQTVLLFSPTCSFIRMRQTSYMGFSRKTKRS
jgi:hypothetical protein